MSSENKADRDKLEYEKAQAANAHKAWTDKYATESKNIEDSHTQALNTLQDKFGELTAGDPTGFSDVMTQIEAGSRLGADDAGNVILTNPDGTTEDLTASFGIEGSQYLYQAQELNDAYTKAKGDWQAEYSNFEMQSTKKVSTLAGAGAAAASAFGLSDDSSTILGQIQQVNAAAYQQREGTASFERTGTAMDQQVETNQSKLSTGWRAMAHQAQQASDALALNYEYNRASLENANKAESSSYSTDQSYYAKIDQAIKDNAGWSFAQGVLGVVEFAAGAVAMFVPGGQAVGVSLMTTGIATGMAGFSGQGSGAGMAQSAGKTGDIVSQNWDSFNKIFGAKPDTPDVNFDFNFQGKQGSFNQAAFEGMF